MAPGSRDPESQQTMKQIAFTIGCFAALALGLPAQDTKPSKAQTETVWTFKIKGIGG